MMIGLGGLALTGKCGGLSVAAGMLSAETQGLAIDFTAMSMAIKDTGTPANAFDGDPNSKLTYASPSTKWILGANGLYSSGTTLRTAYDFSNVNRGCPVEPARTNLFLQSRTFSNASWVKDNGTITANAAVSPTGATDAAAAIPNAGAVSHAVHQDAVATGAVTCAITFFLKIGSLGLPWCEITTVSGTVKRSWVNLSTGAVGTMNHTSMVVTAMPNATGWYRVVVVYTAGAATTDVYVSCRPANGSSGTITGDGTSPAFYIDFAQIEPGSSGTSPIVTVGATVTRAADSIKLATSLMPFSTSVGTLYSQAAYLEATPVGASLQFNEPGLSQALTLQASSPTPNFSVNSGGSVNSTAYTQGTTQKFAGAFASNDVAASFVGGAVGTDATCTPTLGSVTYMAIGSDGSANFMNGYIKQILYVPRRMTNPEIVALAS